MTGSILWKKGEYDIDQQRYFRTDVFNKLEWYKEPKLDKQIEFAHADFIFVINVVNQGTVNLKIKHDNRTDTTTYKQKQPMKKLYRGEEKRLISDENLLDKVMNLNKVQDYADTFMIDIE